MYLFFFFSCSGVSFEFSDTPNIGAHRVSAEKQLTMPPQKRSKKDIPAETDQEEHHHLEGNEISFVPEPSNITDQERRAKLEALMKARAENQHTFKNKLLNSKHLRTLMMMTRP
jgi:hypothetical protein